MLARIPVVVICGTHDPITPSRIRWRSRLESRLPNLVIVPGAGHMVITDDAEMVTDAIEGLLRRVTLVSDYPATECGWPS